MLEKDYPYQCEPHIVCFVTFVCVSCSVFVWLLLVVFSCPLLPVHPLLAHSQYTLRSFGHENEREPPARSIGFTLQSLSLCIRFHYVLHMCSHLFETLTIVPSLPAVFHISAQKLTCRSDPSKVLL